MIIRKKFRFEGAHIVRNCSSLRCKKSIHGHSYIVEVFLESSSLDAGFMTYDFGLMKGTIKDMIDSFDHAYSVWKEDTELIEFIKQHSDRYIILPWSPSAEAYSIMLMYLIDRILCKTLMRNGEGIVRCTGVRVHETETGYAQSSVDDLNLIDFQLEDFVFSQGIIDEWSNPSLFEELKSARMISFINPDPREV